MEYELRSLILFLCCLIFPAAYAEEVFSVPLSKSINLDGNIQEWNAIPYLNKNFCLDFKPPYTDVQSIKVAMDKEFIYLLLNTKNHFGAIKNEPFLKMVIDFDNNKETGSNENLRLNKFVPVPGFERVVTFSLNNKAVPFFTILDVSGNLKKVANYPADGKMSITKGNYMEIKIPFKDLVKENTTVARIIFSEVGTQGDWKNKKAYYVKKLDLSKRNQDQVLSIEEEIQLKEKLDSKFSVAWIIILGFGLWLIWPGIAICNKAGIPTSKAYLCAIPILGPFLFALNLSFGEWKLHKLFYSESGEQ